MKLNNNRLLWGLAESQRGILLAILLTALTIIQPIGVTASRVPQAAARLSLSEVVRSVRAGEPEETIVARIKRNARSFDLTKEEKDELKREGVSDTIIKYLMEPALPYIPGPASASQSLGLVPVYPDDPFAAKMSPEPGAYLLQKSELAKIDLKTLVAATQGALTSKVTMGLRKSKVIGNLVGSSARIRTEAAPVVLYVRLAEPAKIEEVAVVAFASESKQRMLAFSSEKSKDGKPMLKIDAMQRFDSVVVGPRLYKLTLTTLKTGEYFVYLIGSADPEKGIQDKGYDFGVN